MSALSPASLAYIPPGSNINHHTKLSLGSSSHFSTNSGYNYSSGLGNFTTGDNSGAEGGSIVFNNSTLGAPSAVINTDGEQVLVYDMELPPPALTTTGAASEGAMNTTVQTDAAMVRGLLLLFSRMCVYVLAVAFSCFLSVALNVLRAVPSSSSASARAPHLPSVLPINLLVLCADRKVWCCVRM